MDRPESGIQQPTFDPDMKFIRLKEVLSICGKSRSSVYEAIRSGAFPSPVKLGGRSSAWIKSEILQWADSCVKATRSKNES